MSHTCTCVVRATAVWCQAKSLYSCVWFGREEDCNYCLTIHLVTALNSVYPASRVSVVAEGGEGHVLHN